MSDKKNEEEHQKDTITAWDTFCFIFCLVWPLIAVAIIAILTCIHA